VARATSRLGGKVQGSWARYLRHNTKILREGIQLGIANSILVKVNQIGTLTETCRRHLSLRKAARATLRDLASLRGDRGHHHRRHRRSA